MRPFFSPAIALMNRLGYTRKFVLLGLISLVAIAVVVYGLFTSLNQVKHASQRELEGLALIKQIYQTTQLLQQHRVFAAELLGGDEMMRDRCAAKEREVAEAFNAMEGKLPSRLSSSEDFRHIKANWERLRKEGSNLSVANNFDAHTRLIGQILLFEATVSDEYGLILDPEIGTFYLIDTAIDKLPSALEYLGQIRAHSTGILSKRQITEQQKLDMQRTLAKLDDELQELKVNIEKTGSHNPAIQNTLLAASEDIADSAQQIVGIVESDILTGRFAMSSEDFLKMATESINRSYTQMYASLLPTAEALIKKRIAGAEKVLYVSIGIAILLFLIAAYFAAGIYCAIIGSIKSLAHSAHAFAGGDMRARVNLGTRDELSQIGDSFNEMADGFSALLAARKQAEGVLIESYERLQAVIETTLDAVVQMDAEGIIIGWNAQAEKIFGWAREEAIGRMLHETIIPPQYREAHINGLKRFLASGKLAALNSRVELLGLHHDGHEFPIELAVTPIKVAGKYEFSGFIHDITERKQAEKKMLYLENYDALTGLPNRTLFHDRLAQEVRKAHRTGLKMALLFIDLDKFKEVNDTLGHSTGDILLQEVARRIGGCVREADTVARLGGDEFTVILAELDHISSVERVTECIRQALAEPFLLGEETAYVSASIGVTLYPDDATEAGDLNKNAEQAMYAAKNAGRNGFSYFTQSMQQAAQTRLRLINELRGALAANQLMIYYQPIVELATGRIDKAEALIRWQHPELGLVSPAK